MPMVIYASMRSKLRVAIASTPGPLVKRLISFVDEIQAVRMTETRAAARGLFATVQRLTSRPFSARGHVTFVLQDRKVSFHHLTPLDHSAPLKVTEAHDDDGLPHKLEYLTFMGSQRSPYNGLLDIITNRCLESGTNAYITQDHTAYKLYMVGSTGFLKVLPIYLDHSLMPILTVRL